MRNDPFDEEPRRKVEKPSASKDRKRMRAVWAKMKYDYLAGQRSWDWALPRIEERRQGRQ